VEIHKESVDFSGFDLLRLEVISQTVIEVEDINENLLHNEKLHQMSGVEFLEFLPRFCLYLFRNWRFLGYSQFQAAFVVTVQNELRISFFELFIGLDLHSDFVDQKFLVIWDGYVYSFGMLGRHYKYYNYIYRI
jgi:hypothetical protein